MILSVNKDKVYLPIITTLSVLIPVVVAVLMVIPKADTAGNLKVSSLPLFHATLNGCTAFMLMVGYYFMKQKNVKMHRLSMLTAFALSSVFLISYVLYHYTTPSSKFGGEGIIRPIYFFILLTRILLATTIVPLALLSIYRGLNNQIEQHKKISKFTFPIWLYVAITGVVVYVMMSPYYPS